MCMIYFSSSVLYFSEVYLINCMKFITKQKNCFIWLDSEDRYVYTESEILCELEPPVPCSNYRDEYCFSDESYMMACNAIMEKY